MVDRFNSCDEVHYGACTGYGNIVFPSGSSPEDSSFKNIEIISMNQSLMVSGA